MNIIRFSSIGLMAALSSGIAGCGSSNDETPAEAAHPLDAQAITAIEALADKAVAAGIPGVSIAVLRDAQTVTIVRGVSDLATGAALSPEYRFRMASIAKTFVAAVTLQLVAEGKLSLTDTVEARLPGKLTANAETTVEQLLRQQSGIFDFAADERLMAPYFEGDFSFAWTPEGLLALANDHAPDFAPGDRFAYSNTNYLLLAMIVEEITGDTLADVVRERIVEPLGLTSTSFEATSHLDAPYAHGYLVGMGDPIDVTDISGSSVYGCGNLVSTPIDVARFYRALVSGEVVGREQLPDMFAIAPSVPDSPYAEGVFRYDHRFYTCDDFVGHPGDIAGYNSYGVSSLDGTRQFAVGTSSITLDDKAGDEAAQQAYFDLAMAIACK